MNEKFGDAKLASILASASNKLTRKILSHKDRLSIELSNNDFYVDNKNQVNKN